MYYERFKVTEPSKVKKTKEVRHLMSVEDLSMIMNIDDYLEIYTERDRLLFSGWVPEVTSFIEAYEGFGCVSIEVFKDGYYKMVVAKCEWEDM